MYVIVGIGVVPVFHSPEVHRVTTHVTNHVLCVVFPVQLCIALCQPSSCQSVHQGLRLVETTHIAEGSSSFVEFTFLKLRLAQQQPGFPNEGVIFFAPQPFTVLGSLSFRTFPFRLRLDAMQPDGFLALLDSSVILTLADIATLFVAHHVEGEHLCVVVLIAFLFLQVSFDKGLRSVEIYVIARIERVPPSCPCCILLC